jgi:lactam utilization protein B
MTRYLYEAGAVLAALVVGTVGGRFSAPIKTVEKTITIEKTVRDEEAIARAVADARAQWSKEVQDHTVTRTIYKEGKIVEKVVFVDRDTRSEGSKTTTSEVDTKITTHEEATKTVEKEKVTETGRPRLAVGASLPPRYPVSLKAVAPELDVRLLGSVWLGARYVHTDETPFRVALRFEF